MKTIDVMKIKFSERLALRLDQNYKQIKEMAKKEPYKPVCAVVHVCSGCPCALKQGCYGIPCIDALRWLNRKYAEVENDTQKEIKEGQ